MLFCVMNTKHRHGMQIQKHIWMRSKKIDLARESQDHTNEDEITHSRKLFIRFLRGLNEEAATQQGV